jgi:hypothetical protein
MPYRDRAGLRDDPKGPLFRTIGCGTGNAVVLSSIIM